LSDAVQLSESLRRLLHISLLVILRASSEKDMPSVSMSLRRSVFRLAVFKERLGSRYWHHLVFIDVGESGSAPGSDLMRPRSGFAATFLPKNGERIA
jgi:hypothetical protein